MHGMSVYSSILLLRSVPYLSHTIPHTMQCISILGLTHRNIANIVKTQIPIKKDQVLKVPKGIDTTVRFSVSIYGLARRRLVR